MLDNILKTPDKLNNLMPLASLGFFLFMLKTAPFQKMQIDSASRYGKNNRLGKLPDVQYLGRGGQTISLSGVLYPALTGGQLSLSILQSMQEMGEPWLFMSGGDVHGWYIIQNITQTKSAFLSDGSVRKIEFSVSLSQVENDTMDKLGKLSKFSGSALKIAQGILS